MASDRGETIDNIRVKTARASMVMGGLQLALRPITIVSSILLLRLLDPSDFGAMGLVGLLLGLVMLFSGFGMASAVIQSVLERRQVAFIAFAIATSSSLVIFVVVFLSAAPLARLLGDETVAPLIRAMSPTILLQAGTLVPSALLKKDLMFGKVARISLLTELTYIGVAVPLAFLGFGVWSLVYGQLANKALTLILTWLLCPGWDWLIPQRWHGATARSLLRYGLNTTGGGVTGYLIGNWDDWLVGRFLGTTAFGYYRKAYELMDKTVIQLAGHMIVDVLFSSFTTLQERTERLRRAYLKSTRVVYLVIVPIFVGTIVVAPQLVPVLIGEKWVPMVPTLQIFAVMMLTRTLSFTTSSLLRAVGRPDEVFRGGIIVFAFMLPLTLLMLPRGIEGIAIAATLADLFGIAYFIYKVERFLPGTALSTFTVGLPMLFAGAIMGLLVQFSKVPVLALAGGEWNLLAVIGLIAVGAIAYGLFMLLLERDLIKELLRLAWDAFDKKDALRRLLPGRQKTA